MFGNKKVEIPNNTTYMDMWNDLTVKKFAIEDAVTYVKKVTKAIKLYPEGPDKEAEKRELAQAKKSLICAIGEYDGLLAELKNYYTNHYEELKDTRQADWRPGSRPTSHEIVRDAG